MYTNQGLREITGDIYIAVEKILEFKKNLPEIWRIQGTVAIARNDGKITIITVVPRLTSLIEPVNPLKQEIWHDTCLHLPSKVSSVWQDAITNQMIQADSTVQIGEALKYFPVALLIGEGG